MESIRDSGQVIIVEEGIRTSGWGSELASMIYENSFSSLKSEIKRIGALDLPIPSSKSIENTVFSFQIDTFEICPILAIATQSPHPKLNYLVINVMGVIINQTLKH